MLNGPDCLFLKGFQDELVFIYFVCTNARGNTNTGKTRKTHLKHKRRCREENSRATTLSTRVLDIKCQKFRQFPSNNCNVLLTINIKLFWRQQLAPVPIIIIKVSLHRILSREQATMVKLIYSSFVVPKSGGGSYKRVQKSE